MNLGVIAANNLRRNKLRSALTVIGVAIAILAFVLLRTVIWAWTVQTKDANVDRIVTRHKVTFVMHLPKSYVTQIGAMDGVKKVTWATWFGGKDPAHEHEFFATIACDPKSFLEVYDDMIVPPEQKSAWFEDRGAAIAGAKLAQRLGWKVGERIKIESQIYPGDYEFKLVGLYTSQNKSIDPAQLLFNWEYLNESSSPQARRLKDTVGWTIARVKDPNASAQVAVDIDKKFDDQDTQTLSQDERAFQQSFLASFSAILTALDIVSSVILVIMMLILGNTVAMSVRERTGEYAVLRAIGFLPRHLAVLVIGEAGTLGLVGGGLGLLLSYPVVNMGLGRVIEENMGQIFPFFRVPAATAALALALAVALGILAACLPALTAYRLRVVDALRRVA